MAGVGQLARIVVQCALGLGLVAGAACADAQIMPARASESTIHVANAAPTSFIFLTLDAGISTGIWKQRGLDVDAVRINGGGKGAQAVAGGTVDIEIGGAPEMAAIVRGSPVLGIANPVAIPGLMAVVVRPDGPKSFDELKGKTIGVSSAGSLTDWLAREMARREGWGPNGVRVVGVGAGLSMSAALRAGQLDATIQDLPAAYTLEQQHAGRILIHVQQIIPDFLLHTIYANTAFLNAHPDQARAFLAGWFATVDWMRAHKPETVALAGQSLGLAPDIAARAYDELMPMFSRDGRFPAAGLQLLANSFVSMHMLDAPPDMSRLVTEKYLPGAAQ